MASTTAPNDWYPEPGDLVYYHLRIDISPTPMIQPPDDISLDETFENPFVNIRCAEIAILCEVVRCTAPEYVVQIGEDLRACDLTMLSPVDPSNGNEIVAPFSASVYPAHEYGAYPSLDAIRDELVAEHSERDGPTYTDYY